MGPATNGPLALGPPLARLGAIPPTGGSPPERQLPLSVGVWRGGVARGNGAGAGALGCGHHLEGTLGGSAQEGGGIGTEEEAEVRTGCGKESQVRAGRAGVLAGVLTGVLTGLKQRPVPAGRRSLGGGGQGPGGESSLGAPPRTRRQPPGFGRLSAGWGRPQLEALPSPSRPRGLWEMTSRV